MGGSGFVSDRAGERVRDRFGRRAFVRGAGMAALGLPSVAVVLDALAPHTADAALQEVRIGTVTSLTGERAENGKSEQLGAQMAVDEINQAGGVGGKFSLKFVVYDDETKVAIAAASAQKLVGDGVQTMLGTLFSTYDLAINPIIDKGKVVMIVWDNTSPKITLQNPYAFRILYTVPIQGYADAEFMATNLKLSTIATITDNANEGNTATTDRVVNVFTKKFGGKVVAQESFQLGDKDFKAQLTHIKPTAAPCLYISGSVQEVALIAKQCLEIGYKPTYLMGPDSWEDATIFTLAGTEMQQDFHSYYSTVLVSDDPDPDFQKWAKSFRTKYPNWAPGAGALEALSYDAVKVASWALGKAGRYNGDAMRQALMTLVNAPASSGIKGLVTSKSGLTFNSTRDAITPVTIAQLKNNKFTYYAKIQPTPEMAKSY